MWKEKTKLNQTNEQTKTGPVKRTGIRMTSDFSTATLEARERGIYDFQARIFCFAIPSDKCVCGIKQTLKDTHKKTHARNK